MKPVQRVGEIKLHTGQDGQVWFREQGHPPKQTDLSPEDLVGQAWLLDAERVSLLATPANADLICALHSSRTGTHRPRCVMLGNPRLAPGEFKRMAAVFSRMEEGVAPASLGGWRALTEKDYITNALAGVLRSEGKFNNLAERLLRAHPVWPALSFLSDLHKESASELVVAIQDPRWHIDPAKPDALKRLNSMFGLGKDGKRNLAHILIGGPENPPGRHVDRAQMVLDAWTGGEWTPPPADTIASNGFLWRLSQKKAKTGIHGMLRSCHVFLMFIHGVWLDNMTASRVYEPVTKKMGHKVATTVNYMRLCPVSEYSPQLFVPEHFFELSTEVTAYRDHVKLLANRAV